MTFTAVVVDPVRSVMGVASASYSLAVGNAVPALDPRVGVVATQAWTNRAFRGHGLALLREGMSPAQAMVELARSDADFAIRQVAVVDRAGRVAVHTGEGCTPWAGAVTERGRVALGNYLTGPQVLEAVADTLDTPLGAGGDTTATGDGVTAAGDQVTAVAQLLHAALAAGQRAGGDRRGRQSAYLQVARMPVPSTPAGATPWWPAAVDLDLRVDDAVEPLAELERLLRLWSERDRAAAPRG